MKKFELKKSQKIIIGSLFILVGILIISSGKLMKLKEEVIEDVEISLIDVPENIVETNNVTNVEENTASTPAQQEEKPKRVYNYNYIGYLEVPKVGLKRGFLDKNDKYNNIQYNVMISDRSAYPDTPNGNVILIAHSGTAYISYFNKLYTLDIGDNAYVTYKGVKNKYSLVKIEKQPKTGTVAIHRPDYNTKSLTLITCTKDDDTTQTIYIFNIE